MAGDPLARVNPGEPFEPSAYAHNLIVRAVNDWLRLQGPRMDPETPFGGGNGPVEVQVLNSSGFNVDQFGILAVNAPVVLPKNSLPTFAAQRALVGVAPDGVLPVVITQEPIANGYMGAAVILGVTPACLNVLDENHKYAVPTTSTTRLDTAPTGPVRIIWKDPLGSGSGPACGLSGSGDSGVGGRRALVLLQGDGGAIGSTVIARIVDIISVANPPCASGSASASASCSAGSGDVRKPQCLPLYQHAVIQTFDPCCGDWMEATCAVLMEINGKRLVIGDRYEAILIGRAPKTLEAAAAPLDSPCRPGAMPLYAVDAGDITRVILVENHLGKLCNLASGSGSIGTAGQGSLRDLDLYRGIAIRKNERTCLWEPIEDDVLIAHVRGCPLQLNKTYLATWHTGLPKSLLGSGSTSGSGGSTNTVEFCTPLYLTAQYDRAGVADVLCVGGVTKVYKFDPAGDCDDAKFSNNAGCCNCGSGDSSSGGGGGCPCDGHPTAAQFRVASFALTNGSCTSPGCGVFPSSFICTHSLACQWDAGTMPGPCGGSIGASILAHGDGSADLNIGGSGTPGAVYHCASFNCNGVNTFSLVSNDGGCANWPATVTATPV
jgi:hypothetical protein